MEYSLAASCAAAGLFFLMLAYSARTQKSVGLDPWVRGWGALCLLSMAIAQMMAALVLLGYR